MSIRTSANRYAKALFDVALQEKADLSKIGADLSEFAGVLSANRELALAAERAGVPETARVGIVDQVADKLGASAQVKKLLAMLTRDRKLVLAKDLAEAYQERLLAHQNIVLGELTSAAPIAPATVKAIEDNLSKVTGKKVQLTERVDPALIGGVVARIGSTVYDGSVKTQLERLRHELVESAVES
jgi:F-type H+-transporting ATPase subunit delta